jgi:hypothetical protein
MVMTSTTMMASMGIVLALMPAPARSASLPRSGGTIAVTSPPGSLSDDLWAQVSREAAASAFGTKGFTILNDPRHAAYIAEVTINRTEVGTWVEKGVAGRVVGTGAGVNFSMAGGKSVLAPMQRIEMTIRVRGRGDQAVLWQGAAVTVRSIDSRSGGVDRLVLALSQAALSSYPTQTRVTISIP